MGRILNNFNMVNIRFDICNSIKNKQKGLRYRYNTLNNRFDNVVCLVFLFFKLIWKIKLNGLKS